jgi:hypothetical protein
VQSLGSPWLYREAVVNHSQGFSPGLGIWATCAVKASERALKVEFRYNSAGTTTIEDDDEKEDEAPNEAPEGRNLFSTNQRGPLLVHEQ